MNSSSKALAAVQADAAAGLPPQAEDAARLAQIAPAAPQTAVTVAVRVWDPALRAFHWALAASVSGALVTGEIGGDVVEWHGRLGLATAGLLGFRLAWGLIGPDTARFASFVRGPAAIRAYLQGRWNGIGHNPLGALAVIALLGLTAAQVATGLFSNDDISYQGPLAQLISSEGSARLTGLHTRLAWGVSGIIALHLLAIGFYRWQRKVDLITPMLSGRKLLPIDDPATRHAGQSGVAACAARLLLALLVATLVVLGASGTFVQTSAPAVSAAPQTPPVRPSW